ncbi:Hypothetical protein I595_3423 [Croceitalea dokdonensis DOKDO 023]|uniref:Uncharacterized protein n=1 Tax=Croceitalea dokdonensis DOKDO 023 TaxID=1300341 RepID=A0A0P7AVL7_9FLAO|nr:Hypothetical protein I595_3423 [Croceitalea dokdonensis DOKDO 023]
MLRRIIRIVICCRVTHTNGNFVPTIREFNFPDPFVASSSRPRRNVVPLNVYQCIEQEIYPGFSTISSSTITWNTKVHRKPIGQFYPSIGKASFINPVRKTKVFNISRWGGCIGILKIDLIRECGDKRRFNGYFLGRCIGQSTIVCHCQGDGVCAAGSVLMGGRLASCRVAITKIPRIGSNSAIILGIGGI